MQDRVKEKYIILDDETECDIPDPFPLPKFPLDVAVALQKGEITARAYRQLISGVARAMFTFKILKLAARERKITEELQSSDDNGIYIHFLSICISIYLLKSYCTLLI